MPNDRAPAHDDRWGDHTPCSLRYNIVSEKGDYEKFMNMLAKRLHTLIEHDEADLSSMSRFLARLDTESLGRFGNRHVGTYAENLRNYFASETISTEAKERATKDPEYKEYKRLQYARDNSTEYKKAFEIERATHSKRHDTHWRDLIAERLEVLEAIFVILPQQGRKPSALKELVRDVRRFSADSGVLVDVKGDPPILIPLEESLLQKEVLDRLLPRLEARFPDRAADLIKAYHDLLKGVDTNTVFGNAFKALEEVARELSSVPQLQLSDQGALEKAFPGLHGTIRATILKLAAHRGDEAGHGRKGPDEYEIRYLLLSVCNVALVLLEYKEHGG
ncbi:MAG: hypothetical protein KF890_08010 [Nitrospira sp.]|nr:hypothetical protein [Nitrospira sp.]